MTSVVNHNKNYKVIHFILYYLLPFSVAFLLLQFIVFYSLRAGGRSFIWDFDGINQHYPALVYYSDLLKNIVKGREFPMVDFRIGMGYDTITTLNYYAIGDPLTLLTIFADSNSMEGMYRFLILLRLYLSGASFLIYCYGMKKKEYPAVLGALIYVFCGYVFYAGARHPYFTNPMIYLPLLLLGLEYILQKKKPYLFIAATFISALSNFYFFYMLSILVFIYGMIRFFYCHRAFHNGITAEGKKTVGLLFFKTFSKAVLYYCLGILLSAFLFLPVVAAFLNNGRFTDGYDVDLLHYSLGYYVLTVNSFLASNVNSGYWTHLVYAAITPAAIALIFTHKEYRQLRTAFIIGTVFLCIPAIGYFMNGFAYVCNRWEFGYSFLVAYIFAAAYEDLFRLKKLDKILILTGMFLYGVLGVILSNQYVLISILVLFLTIALVFIFNYGRKYVFLQKTFVFILVFCNLGLNGYLTFSAKYGDYSSQFIKAGKVNETIQNSPISLIPTIQDASFYRIESYGDRVLNEALTLNYRDSAGYYSIMDKRVSEYFRDTELLSQITSYRFDNLDNRTYLEALAGVKYIVTSNKKMRPYGYQVINKVKKDGKTYYLLENSNFLPLGYTYNKYIARDDYDKLNALEKQEIMLKAVVLENNDAKAELTGNLDNRLLLPQAETLLKSRKLEVKASYGQGITLEGNTLNVTRKGARVTLSFYGSENSETYLRLKNFSINDSKYLKMDLKAKGDNGINKKINVRSNSHNTYFGKENYLVNLGYRKNGMNQCVVTFNNTGKFHIDAIEVYAVSMDGYEEEIKERSQGALMDATVTTNTITGNTEVSKAALMCLSIPYSKGWTAYVNGRQTKVIQANVMYMAVMLEPGSNHIVLKYRTPYLKEGLILSAAGLFILVGIIVNFHIKNRSERN